MKRFYTSVINKQWIPVMTVSKQFDVRRCRNVTLTREQFPLKPCFGMTMHKCQGATLPSAVISLKDCFTSHTVYVAISQCTDIDSLHLLHFKEKDIKIDKTVVNEMQRLRNNPLKLQTKCPLLNSAVLTIMLLNTRILHYHFQDLLHSPTIQHADVIVLQETFLCPTDRNLDYQL